MAKECSFDIASKIDLQEVDNAVHQTVREIAQRFDFKGSQTTVARDAHAIQLSTEDEFKLRQVMDILESKLVKRGVSLKALDRKPPEPAGGGRVRQEIALQQGIPIEKAREIVKRVKETKRKVQAQIQEDQVRVFSRDKDELQAVIQMLREHDFGIHMQFLNYRS
jgi:uncharacterized protein YajQ (UPF0234 family)